MFCSIAVIQHNFYFTFIKSKYRLCFWERNLILFFNRSLHRRVWGEFSFFFVCALDIFKVWCEESFFCKKHFCSNKCKNGNLPKKKTSRHHPSRTFEKTWRSHPYDFGELFYLEFPPFFLFCQGKFVFFEQFLFTCIKLNT